MAEQDEELILHSLHCVKCGHTWIPRTATLPKTCPRCKNFNWKEGNTAWNPERIQDQKHNQNHRIRTRPVKAEQKLKNKGIKCEIYYHTTKYNTE